VVEAAVAGFVVAVSVAGLVVSICYGRQLERSTRSTWRATCAATATMEQIRADSMNDWSTLPTTWNAASCQDAGLLDPIAGNLVASVNSNAAALDSSNGMWTTGSPVPNYYFVQISPAAAASDVAKSLVFQTYVANRGMSSATLLEDLTGTSYFATSGTTSTTTQSAKLSTADATISISGANGTDSVVTLKNTSSLNLLVSSLKITVPATVKMSYVSLNGIVLFNNAAKPTSTVSCATCLALLPTGLLPGDIRIEVRAAVGSLSSATVSYGFTFADKSTKTVTVTP
jgi:hypothetical protein